MAEFVSGILLGVRYMECDVFREIGDETFGRASAVIDQASTPIPEGEESRPALLAAGAAYALERGSPHLLFETRKSIAGDYLEIGTREWRYLHRAMARHLDMREQSAEMRTLNSVEAVGMIANDTEMQIAADHISRALRAPEAFDGLLGKWQKAAFEMARMDPDYAAALEQVKSGRYENLRPEDQSEFMEALRTRGGEMGPAIEEAGMLVDRVERRFMERDERYSSQFYGGFHFEEVKGSEIQAALERLHLGTSTGIATLDEAIDGYGAVRRLSDPMEVGLISPADQVALGRLFSDHEKMDHLEADEFLTRALGDRSIMEQAELDCLRGISREGLELEAKGRYDLLRENDILRITSAFACNSHVSPIDQVRAQAVIVNGPDVRGTGISTDQAAFMARETQMAAGY